MCGVERSGMFAVRGYVGVWVGERVLDKNDKGDNINHRDIQ